MKFFAFLLPVILYFLCGSLCNKKTFTAEEQPAEKAKRYPNDLLLASDNYITNLPQPFIFEKDKTVEFSTAPVTTARTNLITYNEVLKMHEYWLQRKERFSKLFPS